MPDASLDLVLVDPPYGLEFMGHEWDNLSGPVRSWEVGGGFSKGPIGLQPLPSYTSHGQHGNRNPTCEVCGGRLRGKKKCSCEQPHDHWKPISRRKAPKGDVVDDFVKVGGYQDPGGGNAYSRSRIRYGGVGTGIMQEWHARWLAQAFRLLRSGGFARVFSGTRTFHRLAAAMEDVGFRRIGLEAWVYGSGFPKSLAIGKAIDGHLGVERPVIGRAKGRGSNAGSECYNWNNPNDTADRTYYDVTGPGSEESEPWEGWGTALKPSWEPIVVGQKP